MMKCVVCDKKFEPYLDEDVCHICGDGRVDERTIEYFRKKAEKKKRRFEKNSGGKKCLRKTIFANLKL